VPEMQEPLLEHATPNAEEPLGIQGRLAVSSRQWPAVGVHHGRLPTSSQGTREPAFSSALQAGGPGSGGHAFFSSSPPPRSRLRSSLIRLTHRAQSANRGSAGPVQSSKLRQVKVQKCGKITLAIAQVFRMRLN